MGSLLSNLLSHLLWWHVEGHGPEVHLLVGVDAGDDEEDAGTLGAALAQPTQAEDDGALVLRHDLMSEMYIV